MTREHLGQVGEVTITKDDTLLLQPGGSKEAIDARVEEIKQTVADTKSDYEKEKLNVGKYFNGGLILLMKCRSDLLASLAVLLSCK